YAADGWRVIACARTPEKVTALQKLRQSAPERVAIHTLDVEDHAAIDRLTRTLRGEAIDLLLNVAGWFGSDHGFRHSDFAEWERLYRINVIGPMKMIEAFVDHVAASTQKKIVSLSSVLGSIARTSGGMVPYRASKTALNMVVRCLATELKPRGIIVVPLHPGW